MFNFYLYNGIYIENRITMSVNRRYIGNIVYYLNEQEKRFAWSS